LPLGTVVASLPAGCTPTPVGEMNFYKCGQDFHEAVYEGKPREPVERGRDI
jgi:hypothetical protein